MNDEIKLHRNRRTGILSLPVPIPGTVPTKYRQVTTGERDYDRAMAVVKECGADRLIHLANAEAVTVETIAIITQGLNFSCRRLYELWRERMAVSLAPRTVDVYKGHMASFFTLNKCWDKPLSWVTESHLDQWINGGDAHRGTMLGRMKSALSLFRFANATGVPLQGNPAALVRVHHRNLSIERIEPMPVKPFIEEQYQKMISLPVRDASNWRVVPHPGPEQHWRDWAILAYCCGYRLTDCVSLQWDSIREDSVLIYPHKATKTRPLTLSLSDPLIGRPELLQVLDRLRKTERKDPVYIWPEHRDRYVVMNDVSGYFSQFTRWMGKAGLEGGRKTGLTFHSFRRGCAVRLHAAGRTLAEVGLTLGHWNQGSPNHWNSPYNVTKRYTDSVNNL